MKVLITFSFIPAVTDCCKGSKKMKTLPPTALSVNEGTSVIKEEYSGSNGLKVIGFTIVNGGGHTWPGGSRYMPEFMVGSVTRNLNACREIWNFFKGNRPAAFN